MGMIPMSDDIESSEYDLVTNTISLIRIGNIVQVLFSQKIAAKVFYMELAAKFKRDQEQNRGT